MQLVEREELLMGLGASLTATAVCPEGMRVLGWGFHQDGVTIYDARQTDDRTGREVIGTTGLFGGHLSAIAMCVNA